MAINGQKNGGGGGGPSIVLTDPGTGQPAVKAIGVDVNNNSQINVVNRTATLATLMGEAGTNGQFAVPTDAPGVVRYTGVAGKAQYIAPYGAVEIIDLIALANNTPFNGNISGLYSRVHLKLNASYNAFITLTLPESGYYGQEITVTRDYTTTFGSFVNIESTFTQFELAKGFAITFTYANLGVDGITWYATAYEQVGLGNSGGELNFSGRLGVAGGYVGSGSTTAWAVGYNAVSKGDGAGQIGPGINTGNNSISISARNSRADVFCYKAGQDFFYSTNFESSLWRDITTTTSTELTTTGNPPTGTDWQYDGRFHILPGDRLVAVEVAIMATLQNVNTTVNIFSALKAFTVAQTSEGVISIAGAITDLFTPVKVGLAANITNTATVVAISVDNTNKSLVVAVTQQGTSDGSMRWVARLKYRPHTTLS